MPANPGSDVFLYTAIALGGFTLLSYLFMGIALYKMGKHRGEKRAWLAFIPGINYYYLGNLADQINLCYNKKSNWKYMALCAGADEIISLITFRDSVQSIIDMVSSFLNNRFALPSMGTGSLFFPLLLMVIGFIGFVASLVCYYKLFQDYALKHATLFLVLSIFFLAPFVLFFLRNRPSASQQYALKVHKEALLTDS